MGTNPQVLIVTMTLEDSIFIKKNLLWYTHHSNLLARACEASEILLGLTSGFFHCSQKT